MLTSAATASSLILGSSHCHTCHLEGVNCSNNGITASWLKQPFEIQRVSDHSGISFKTVNSRVVRVSVAADYSDSSNLIGENGYHPLEELKNCKRIRDTKLTPSEIARTTVEANNTALLIFPGLVHSEPHEQNSWAEFQYVVDEYGDIFFEIDNNENILDDPEANNPVSVLIAMDMSQYTNRWSDSMLENEYGDDIELDNLYYEYEVGDYETPDMRVDWGMPNSSKWVHPIYFSKCLSKAVYAGHDKLMDHPSNGVSIRGELKPAFIDEEIYLRRLFSDEESDGYTSDWKDEDILNFSSQGNGRHASSTIYRLDIMKIELLSVYGIQSEIPIQDFQDAEPDILVHSGPGIIEGVNEESVALRALCRKKGIHVEGAHLIGVDSLGIDVRVCCGSEVTTLRFPFKLRATSESAAEKQIKQLLFPRSRRKRFRMHEQRTRDIDAY